MTKTFDVAVIGAGMTGQVAASRIAKSGKQVVITDELPYGGTCALRGCDPKKMLIAGAEAIDWARRMEGSGIVTESINISWEQLQTFKRGFTDPVPENVERSLRKAGVDTRHASARFLSPSMLDIGGEVIEAEQIVIATGAEPFAFPFAGAEMMVDSTEFLNLESLPSDITFVGGGFISFEFAHLAARAGSTVRIVEMAERPLGPFEPELVEALVDSSRSIGITISTSTKVLGVRREDDSYRVVVESNGKEEVIKTEMVVHGGGRVPRLDPLDPEAGEVSVTRQGVDVDETLQSRSNPRVWAGGDVADAGIPLTPVAVAHGHVIAANIVRGADRAANIEVVPSVVFTLPALARVGPGEEAARERGLDVEVKMRETSDWYSSRRINESSSMFKVIVERGSGRIVGAHLLGHGVDEVINIFALAIRHQISATALKQLLWAYPTRASDIPYMV